MGERT